MSAWTRERPEFPGYYWARATVQPSVTDIIEVRRYSELVAILRGATSRGVRMIPLRELRGVDEWAGPLVPPP